MVASVEEEIGILGRWRRILHWPSNGLQSDQRMVVKSNCGISRGRNQYFGQQQYHKGQQRTLLLLDYLSNALISSFSAASTYEEPSGAVPDLDAPFSTRNLTQEVCPSQMAASRGEMPCLSAESIFAPFEIRY